MGKINKADYLPGDSSYLRKSEGTLTRVLRYILPGILLSLLMFMGKPTGANR